MSATLEIRDLTKHFGGLAAVSDCSLSIAGGALVGLMGPNGAGKSTFFNLITGLLTPDSGEVLLDGEDITGKQPDDLVRMGMGRTFQVPVSFPTLTVLENVLVAADRGNSLREAITGSWKEYEVSDRDRAYELLGSVGLADRADELADTLSGGELHMLEVARQLITEPRILLLDEPTAGVAPHLQQRLADLIKFVHGQHITMVIIEHNLTFLLDLVDHVVCLADGQLLAQGSPDEMRSNPAVVGAYLGGTSDAT